MPQLDVLWHMHEMLFGFAIAIIAGFLLTAARNWTGLCTPRGKHLIFTLMKNSRNTRNYPILGILTVLFLSNFGFHLANSTMLTASLITFIQFAILIIVVLETVISGRIIPGFTSNAVIRSTPIINENLNKFNIAITLLAIGSWGLQVTGPISASLSFVASVAQGWRLCGWKPWKVVAHPLLWILHLACAWIPIGFIFLGLAELGVGTYCTAFHSFGIGSMASLIIRMITRTALGHTGRLLNINNNEIMMYLLIQSGAFTRICANILHNAYRNILLLIAGVLWGMSFLLYLIVYTPYLRKVRLDGREG
jgi:uncharacterized protein involved in response to NO